jgi:Ni2+-binding GTPase involved in maturation of urease and hydrogenase
VTEGEDKPLKYPLMLRVCELVILNEIDLLAHLDFALDRLAANNAQVNPGPTTMQVSTHGRGRRRLWRLDHRRARASQGNGLTGAFQP